LRTICVWSQPFLDERHREALGVGADLVDLQRATALERGRQPLQLAHHLADLLIRGAFYAPLPAIHSQQDRLQQLYVVLLQAGDDPVDGDAVGTDLVRHAPVRDRR
jgi:hypothetical protein